MAIIILASFILGITIGMTIENGKNTIYKTKEVCKKSQRELLIDSAKETCGSFSGLKSVETFSDNSIPQIKFECK